MDGLHDENALVSLVNSVEQIYKHMKFKYVVSAGCIRAGNSPTQKQVVDLSLPAYRACSLPSQSPPGPSILLNSQGRTLLLHTDDRYTEQTK
jgi:hypothetical protein